MQNELSFLRPIYKTLFLQKRSYASFNRQQVKTIINTLNPKSTVLDPMSGYGFLAEVCREKNISTFFLELNPPSYLLQLLFVPENIKYIQFVSKTLNEVISNVHTSKKFDSSDSWFPPESERILKIIWENAIRILEGKYQTEQAEDYLAAVLLPFIGRLCSYSSGTLNIFVKKGGIVFYDNWKFDFMNYLGFLNSLCGNLPNNKNTTHEITYGNILTYKCPRKFSYFITSPPYPNMRDYYTFFFPENYAIENIFCITKFMNRKTRDNIIGSARVSDFKKNNEIDFEKLSSVSAIKFLEDLSLWKGPKRSIDDNKAYYIPYYYSYFLQLEQAFANVEKMLTEVFSGYVVVVNNTARKFVIPVNKCVNEIWESFGCKAQEDETLTNERSHVGAINPRAIGFKARHTEYAIRISRGK